MKEKRLLKNIIIYSLCIVLILMHSTNIKADEKPKVTINKITGTLTFTTTDTKASTSIRWKTVGFTVCREKTNGNPLQDTDGNPKTKDYATIWLPTGEKDDPTGYKTEREIGDNQVEVTFVVYEDAINDAFKGTGLEEIKDNDIIYLNGIFKVKHGDKELSQKYYTEEGIKGAEDWANKDDFIDHFDLEAIYHSTKTYPVTIERQIYHSSGNEIYSTKDYEKQKKGETFKTDSNKIKTQINDGDKTYYLYRVYYQNLKKDEKPGKKLGNRKTEVNPNLFQSQYETQLEFVRDREFQVKPYGLKIVALYRLFPTLTTTHEEEEQERGFEEIDPTAVIDADARGEEKYDVTDGIPGTESVYANVLTSKWLSSYKFTRKFGKISYPINVKKTYKLTWTETDPDGEEVSRSNQVPITRTYIVQRDYSYWVIDSLAVYGIDKAVLNNDALPGGSVTLTPNGYSSPTVSYTHHEDQEDHITQPVIRTVVVEGETISGNTTEPSIPNEDFTALAEENVAKIKCKNDKLTFNGTEIMTNEVKEEKTEKPKKIPSGLAEIGEDVLYKSNLVIPGTKANKEYKTTGKVIYKPIVEFHADTDTNYTMDDINSVVVHTPTVCDAMIEDNLKDNQMINPDSSKASLVLDRPFYVTLPTTGIHRNIKGYGYQDYEKYIAKREVKFPFDVYRGSSIHGTFIPRNTWTSLAEDVQFYLPTWVTEGQYTIQYRSAAINAAANSGMDNTENLANTKLSNYVATDESHVEVSGRIYGLNLFDISDYPTWETVFRSTTGSLKLSGFKYTVGTKDQNGNSNGQNSKYTLTLVNGSHPNYKNIGAIKTGYVTRFSLKTVGNMSGDKDYIHIKPRFYYVDYSGKNRQEVDIYYSEPFQSSTDSKIEDHVLVKMGSRLDLENHNTKALYTSDPHLAIPEADLKQTAYFSGMTLKAWKAQRNNVFTFTNILIPQSLRTLVGYVADVPSTTSEKAIASSVQNWYCEYYMPGEIHVVPKDFDIKAYCTKYGALDYHESFWLKKGYIIVNFDIETIKDGVRHLSYINSSNAKNGYCNMWNREGYQYQKTDYKGSTFHFQDGDYVMYWTDKSVMKDYISSGTH